MTIGHVEFERVWKKFRYGELHNRLRDAIPAAMARALRRRDPAEGLWTGEFWALRDVSFTVPSGHALGIIGPNGAGKSTILKLLTRILRPTHGHCAVQGRVGALIEVTAGFHPDLTGRENVYLQGVIMGMPKREIRTRFDQIVDFAGIAPFIDTPVKRYSSGMQARLGFSIAAHLEPDVLIVDEVLAVGDQAFQEIAFARVTELVRQEIPVVVVSHQLDAITALCTDALLLERGRVVRSGTPRECIAAYLEGLAGVLPPAPGDGAIRIESLRTTRRSVDSGQYLGVTLACSIREDGWAEPESIRLRVRAAQTGETVFEIDTRQLGAALPAAGRFVVELELQMNVPRGIYLVEALVWDSAMGRQSFAGPVTHIDVHGGPDFAGSVQMNPHIRLLGDVTTSRPRAASASG